MSELGFFPCEVGEVRPGWVSAAMAVVKAWGSVRRLRLGLAVSKGVFGSVAIDASDDVVYRALGGRPRFLWTKGSVVSAEGFVAASDASSCTTNVTDQLVTGRGATTTRKQLILTRRRWLVRVQGERGFGRTSPLSLSWDGRCSIGCRDRLRSVVRRSCSFSQSVIS